MSAWIGPLGNLLEFKCPSAVDSSTEDSHVFFAPLGGDVATTILGDGTRPRVWDVSVSAARPDHVTTLQGLTEGAWGPGPFVFIPPAAESKNLLGKRDALCLGAPGSGYSPQPPGSPVTTSEGVTGSAYVASSLTPAEGSFGAAPVIPGQTVTGKAWIQAGLNSTATLRMTFYSAGHTDLGSTTSTATTSMTGAFLHRTATAPATAAYVTLRAVAALITYPQITWTDGPRTWSPSKASANVVASPLSDSVRRATGRAGEEVIADHRFTVTELRA